MNNQGTLTIETTNIKAIHVKYYIINAEILFSRAPFMKDNTESFSYVKPYLAIEKQMVKDESDVMQMNSVS